MKYFTKCMGLFRNSPLVVKLLICFILITFIPLSIINQVWYRTAIDLTQELSTENYNQIFERVNAELENSLDEVNRISLSIMYDIDIFDNLANPPVTISEKIDIQRRINEKLLRMEHSSKIISSITIVGDGLNFSSTNTPTRYDVIREQDWFKSFIAGKEKKAYTGLHYNNYFADISKGKKSVFSLIRLMADPESGKQLGVLVIDIKSELLESILKNLLKYKGFFVIYDNQGKLVYDLKQEENIELDIDRLKLLQGNSGVYPLKVGGKDALVYRSEIKYTSWQIASIVEKKALFESSIKVKGVTRLLSILLMFLIAGMAVVISLFISKPLTRLTKKMQLVEQGDLGIRAEVDSGDEVGRLGHNFNNMLDRIEDLISEVYEEQEKKRKMELKALQVQIHPHFLYNTLNTIRWMALIQKAENIEKMIVALIQLLEFSGKNHGEYVTIGEELEHVKKYVYLQQVRYGNKFNVQYHTDEDLLGYRTIKFILQPIVENAIFHGIEPKNGSGEISITIKDNGSGIGFEVKDDGIGIDLENNKHKKFSGLGIENVNERLKGSFGSQAQLNIQSIPGLGTVISFEIPKINRQEG